MVVGSMDGDEVSVIALSWLIFRYCDMSDTEKYQLID